MTKKKTVLATVATIAVLLVVVLAAMRAAQSVDDSPAPMIAHKNAQLATLDQLEQAHETYAGVFNPRQHEATLRDSGRNAVGLFIENIYFCIAGAIAFDTQRLSALLVPKDPTQPVAFDDPGSFVFHPLNGSVSMLRKALSALFNQYLTDYSDTPMRNISIKTQDNRMVVAGESSKVPGLWLPFHMEGSGSVKRGHLFVYEPDTIESSGIETKGLLNGINLQLSKLLQIDTRGAQLEGNNVVLDLSHALPPPAKDVNVSKMAACT